MPAKATLFDHRADPIHEFGTSLFRNTVRFNPQGRYILSLCLCKLFIYLNYNVLELLNILNPFISDSTGVHSWIWQFERRNGHLGS